MMLEYLSSILVWFFIHNIIFVTSYSIIKVIKGDVVNFKSYLVDSLNLSNDKGRLIK